MIATMDHQTHGSGFAAAVQTVATMDEKVNRVLDSAEFHHRKERADGSHESFFQLRKPVGGLKAGTVLSLAQLHELLFGKR
jgi:hypothetical protein